MRILIVLVSVAALALALVMAALGPGSRLGLWEFGQAFGIMRTIAVPTLAAGGAALLVLLLALWKARGLILLALAAVLAAGAAAYAPMKMRAMVEANPIIHDITTDFGSPPEIIAGAGEARKNPPEYVGAERVRDTDKTVAEAQREAFPDIGPLYVDAGLAETAKAAKESVLAMGMDILAEGPAGEAAGSGWRIEAVATSFWYGFKDDFVVRLTPEDGKTRIDVRSKSRVGGSDLGANARRVRTFLQKLDAAV